MAEFDFYFEQGRISSLKGGGQPLEQAVQGGIGIHTPRSVQEMSGHDI